MVKGSSQPNVTPAMRQFHRFKEQYPQCVLFFRMGDFYEMFHDDAKLAAKVLGITLTQRTEGVPMAGVPYHAVDRYLRRMIQAGHRVALCDQVEDPNLAKGVVKRDVTRVITPGTLTDEDLLEEGLQNPLAAVMFHDDEYASLAWAELSTGSFHLGTFEAETLGDELARIGPSELLYVATADGKVPDRTKSLLDRLACSGAARAPWQFSLAQAVQTLHKQFQVKTLSGFGLEEDDPVLGPAGALLAYLLETQKADASGRISHLQPPRRLSRDDHLVIDQVSLGSLEIERTMRSGQTAGSLLGTLQTCRTAMGKRLLRQWLCYPLCARQPIEARQRVVGALVEDSRFMEPLRDLLDQVQDVHRIVGRVAVGRATPRDLAALGQSAAQATLLGDLLGQRPAVVSYYEGIMMVAGPLGELADKIKQACVDAPPYHLREGGLIRDGYDQALDETRNLQHDSDAWLAHYQKQLIDDTGLTHIKVGYNKIFGFYIELSASNRDRAPDSWSRKQTLKNAERFITPQLKEYEVKVLSARQRAVAREQELFVQLCETVQDQLHHLYEFGRLAAELDVLGGFADRAARHAYVKPVIVDEPVLDIRGGRHPVLDQVLGDQFVPNDVALTAPEGASLALITGPNMAGKSTYIRQTALIVLLAHTGSFVPADEATIGLCDRIFTRVGASDELHAGQSTFMVEMTETANICHHASERSLVILDEIGRGTSTLDGLSLAWSIAEFLGAKHCRALFATHYHELTHLSEQYPNIINLNVTVREWQDQIVFLHRIVPGATDRSYGIHVAKIAGLPQRVVQRAHELLEQLEVSHNAPTMTVGTQGIGGTGGGGKSTPVVDEQLPLFTQYLEHPIVEQLRKLNLDQMTPLAAFDALRKLHDTLAANGERPGRGTGGL